LKNSTFTITKSGEDYNILSASGKYIGKSAYSNGLDTSNSAVANGIAFSDGSATITAAGGCMLKFNKSTDQMRFRYYKSGQEAVALYKLVESDGSATTYYTIYCVHNYESEVTDPTCENAGYTTYTCTVCGVSKQEAGEAATGHDYESVVTNPTCTTDGYTTHTCSVCGDTYTDNIVVATGHSYVDGICSVCGAEDPKAGLTGWVKTDLVDIKDTDIVIITWTKNGTTYAISSANGTDSAPTAVVVTVNGQQLTDGITDSIKWNISNSNGNLTIYPNGTTETWLYCTNTNNGVRVGTNETNTFTIDATSGYLKHTGTNRYVGVYTDGGDVRCYDNTTGNIANQTIAFYVIVPCTTHTWKDATCTAPQTCSVCGATQGETAAHTEETIEAVAPTCTESGLTAGTKCSVCKAVLVEQEEVAALGHTTESGTCERCNQTIGGSSEPETPAEPTVALEITADAFNTTSYAANNNTKEEGDYSYTSYQVMKQGSAMQWQKSKGYITIANNEFVKMELTITAGTFTVTVGGNTVSGTTDNGVTTYDLTGLEGEIRIAVGGATGKVDYIKFYK